MSTRAYILMEVQVGRANQVSQALRELPGVVNTDVITGPYDLIGEIAVDDITAMADLVTGQMQGVRGVLKTTTCVAAS